MKNHGIIFVTGLIGLFCVATQLPAQESLPFPEPSAASTAGKTLNDSKHQISYTDEKEGGSK